MVNRGRFVALVLVGAAALMLKGRYSGPGELLVHGYLGNVAASFAVYFLARVALAGLRGGRAWSAALSLAVVEAFEILDGFGVMANVYDAFDLIANAVGVAAGWGVDRVVSGGEHSGVASGS